MFWDKKGKIMPKEEMGVPQEEVTSNEEKIKAEEELKNKEGENDPAEGSEEKRSLNPIKRLGELREKRRKTKEEIEKVQKEREERVLEEMQRLKENIIEKTKDDRSREVYEGEIAGYIEKIGKLTQEHDRYDGNKKIAKEGINILKEILTYPNLNKRLKDTVNYAIPFTEEEKMKKERRKKRKEGVSNETEEKALEEINSIKETMISKLKNADPGNTNNWLLKEMSDELIVIAEDNFLENKGIKTLSDIKDNVGKYLFQNADRNSVAFKVEKERFNDQRGLSAREAIERKLNQAIRELESSKR